MRRARILFRVNLLVLLAALVAIVPVSLSDGDAGTEVEVGTLSAAAATAIESGTCRLAVEFTLHDPETGETVTFGGEGAFDLSGERGHLSMDLAGLLGGAAPDGETTMDLVFQGDLMYLRSAPVESLLPPGRPWLRIDLQASAEEHGIDLEALRSGQQGSPTDTLGMLHGSGDVEVVGQEEVRGVATTHYRALVSMEDAIAEAPEDERDDLRRSFEAMGVATDVEFPVEAWVDDDGLPRRIRFELDLHALGAPDVPPGATMAMSMELFDYGAPVDVRVPGDDEVVDPRDVPALREAF